MIGTTLGDIRSYVESLASESGSYVLVCARYGNRPVPAAELRFETRAAARAAARATEQYRAALRRYDPRLPKYDVVACQAVDGRVVAPGCETGVVDESNRCDGPETEPGVSRVARSELDRDGGPADRSSRVEYCHRVAAAVFEALSAGGHDGVESAVMDDYFELAERVPDLDDLCLCLLEGMATEIERRLTPAEQARVIETAVGRLPGQAANGDPIAATLASLERRGLVGSCHRSNPIENGPADASVVVRVSEYALSPREGRLPVLPIVLELGRHLPAATPSLDAAHVGDEWRLRIDRAGDDVRGALASARIRPEV